MVLTEYEHLHTCNIYKPVTNTEDSQEKGLLHKLKNSQKMPLKIRLIKWNHTTAPGHGPTTEFFLPVLGSVLTTASHWTSASHSRGTGFPAEQASQPLPCFSLSCPPTPPHPPYQQLLWMGQRTWPKEGKCSQDFAMPQQPLSAVAGSLAARMI